MLSRREFIRLCLSAGLALPMRPLSKLVPILFASRRPGYFVDASGGNDNNAGNTPAQAWQTLAKVEATTFAPGSAVSFKAGETWAEMLTLTASKHQNLLLTRYGSGAAPIIDGGGVRTECIYVSPGCAVRLSHLHLNNPTTHGAVFFSGNNLVTDCSIENSGNSGLGCSETSMTTIQNTTIRACADEAISGHDDAVIVLDNSILIDNEQGINTSTASTIYLTVTRTTFSNITDDYYPSAGNVVSNLSRCLFIPQATATHICYLNDADIINYCVFDLTNSPQTIPPVFLQETGTLEINNCTFYGGTGANKGGWVANDGRVTNLNNCIHYNNWRLAFLDVSGVVNADYCNLFDLTTKNLTTETNAVAGDPLLNADFTLQAASPCRNAGKVISGLTTDYAGNAVQSPPSLGALEYVA